MERCKEPGDWLRREIETAIDEKRNIVPLMLEGFDFGSPITKETLTGKLATLNTYNGLSIYSEYFFAAMDKLRNRFLSVALEDVQLHPLTAEAKEANEAQKIAASEAAPVEKEELTAQEWYERGRISTGNDEKIRCYTEAIRLKPNYADAHFSRGLAYQRKGELNKAIEGYRQAIAIEPDRGDIRGSLTGALRKLGRTIDAQEQEKIARLSMEKEVEYNRACFEAVCGNIDKAIELLKIWLEKRPTDKTWAQQDPDFESLRDDPRFKALVSE